MKPRRGRAWSFPATQLVTYRREASYRTPDEELVIPEGTQLIGVVTEGRDPALRLGLMTLAISHELVTIEPNPNPARTLETLARETAEAGHAAMAAGDPARAAVLLSQSSAQHRLLGDVSAANDLTAAAQTATNRAARTPEGLAEFDRHTADLSDEALRQLGAAVRLLVRQLGGFRYAPSSAAEAMVAFAAVRLAVAQVASLDRMERLAPPQPITPATMWVNAESLVGDLLEEPDGPPEMLAALAEVAIAIDPDDADGYCMMGRLARQAGQLPVARSWFEAAVRAGERKLGRELFADPDRPRFWLMVETRPYMRARAALAGVLTQLGERERACDEYWAMLELNPGDNQGIRYVLASLLLERADLAGVERLYRMMSAPQLDDWDDEDDEDNEDAVERGAPDMDPLDPAALSEYESAMWLYPAALYWFLKEGDGERARAALRLAHRQNPHVAPLLTGRSRLSGEGPGSYTHGSRDEAEIYVREGRAAWAGAPNAIAWLREQISGKSPARRAAPAPAPGPAPTSRTLRALLDAWVRDEGTPQAAQSKKVYRAVVARLIDRLETGRAPATAADLTEPVVAAFLAQVEPARRSQARNSIRVWCDWLVAHGALSRSPVTD